MKGLQGELHLFTKLCSCPELTLFLVGGRAAILHKTLQLSGSLFIPGWSGSCTSSLNPALIRCSLYSRLEGQLQFFTKSCSCPVLSLFLVGGRAAILYKTLQLYGALFIPGWRETCNSSLYPVVVQRSLYSWLEGELQFFTKPCICTALFLFLVGGRAVILH